MSTTIGYRTLLATHLADAPPSALAPAVAFARTCEAHLDVLVLEPLSPMPTMTFALDPGHGWDEAFAESIRRAETRGREVERWLESERVSATVSGEALPLGLVGERVAEAALCTDLVVVRGTDSLVGGASGRALEGALFGAGQAALVLTEHTAPPSATPAEVMIAWDGGREAARAVRRALPLLKAARTVRTMIVEEGSDGELARTARGLERYLSRHGVHPLVERVEPDGRFVAHALVEHVRRRAPELLVMGGYGHTRLRERLFSGATRAALSELDVALLLSH